jgi:hypothetical protein
MNFSVAVQVLLGILLIVGCLISVIWFLLKYAALPWLRAELTAPMQRIETQVTENGHTRQTPTVIDRIDEVKQIALEAARHGKEGSGLAKEAIAEINALSRMFDGHLDWSQEQVDLMWLALHKKKDGSNDA